MLFIVLIFSYLLCEFRMVIVTGATGFIGSHLIKMLTRSMNEPIRAITRQSIETELPDAVEFIQGDINHWRSLSPHLEPGATLINLAYSNQNSLGDVSDSISEMIEVCAEKGIKRLIHCSSISVYGRVKGRVTEQTLCAPIDEYGKMKLAVEKTLLDQVQGRFELVILRPTEVFGSGGKTLRTLINALLMHNKHINYMRSSLFGRRRTHLVPVETVVDAIRFLCVDKREYRKEIFMISADAERLNSFYDIEQLLREELCLIRHPLPLIMMPRIVLENVMRIAGRATVDSNIIYSASKLEKLGFHNQYCLKEALRIHARTYINLNSIERVD